MGLDGEKRNKEEEGESCSDIHSLGIALMFARAWGSLRICEDMCSQAG
jgi:hypothetical protein